MFIQSLLNKKCCKSLISSKDQNIICVIKPCCPRNNSRKRLKRPTQIIGVTSTPPIGATIFLVATRIGSVGKKIIGHKLVLKSILGYQVKIILRRNARVRAPITKPIKKCRVGRLFINRGITKLKALLNRWYKSSFIA